MINTIIIRERKELHVWLRVVTRLNCPHSFVCNVDGTVLLHLGA